MLNFTAFTVEKVTGDMKAMKFPELEPRLTVDVLIGLCKLALFFMGHSWYTWTANSTTNTVRMDMHRCSGIHTNVSTNFHNNDPYYL